MKGTALVSGATSGFGRQIAKRLSEDGYKLIILGRRNERLQELKNELKDAFCICADVRDKEAIFSAIQNLPENFKDIEVLVNNAGLALGQEKFSQSLIDDFEVMIDTNIKGLLYLTKAVLPIMQTRKSGYIFNIGSVAGQWPYPGGHVYGGTKAFVEQFSYNLRNDLRGDNIRVTLIAPGIAKTEFSLVRFKGDEARSEAVYDGTEYLQSDDIASVIVNCLNLPKSVNLNIVELVPTTQTWAGFHFERE